jgi:D-3-phosphoglycerate dehydrogenase
MTASLTGRVAVTPRSLSLGHPALTRLEEAGLQVVFPAPGRTPTPGELAATIPGCVGWLAGVEPVTRELLEASPLLRVVARNGVGVDNVDLDAAADGGIAVRPAVGANARGVAELAIGLLLAAARQIPWGDAHLKTKQWERRRGVELAGRTLGVVGLGNIGRTVAELASAFGMEVLGHDPYPPTGWTPPQRFRWASLDDLAAASDMVSLHVPATGAPIVDVAFLGRMRPGGVLVNTARAELVDESAVLAALDDGTLSAYAVDAFTTEPPLDWTLAGDDRVVATPHIGGYTAESVERAGEAAVEAILEVLRSG